MNGRRTTVVKARRGAAPHPAGGSATLRNSHVHFRTSPRLALALLILLALLAPPAAAGEAPVVCAGCDAEIAGRYFLIRDVEGTERAYCAACRENLPACAFCRHPVRDGVERDGKPACPACAARFDAAPACALCGRRLLEAHVVYTPKEGGEKTHVCRVCAKSAPACALCGVPSNALETVGGKSVCPDCRAKLPVCRTCGAPMPTRTSFILSGYSYCPECVRRNPPCDSCGAPAAGGRALPDGRLVCADCDRDAVTDVKEVEGMLARIRETTERSLGMKVRAFRKVAFADKQEIARLFRRGGGDRERRMEEYPLGLFVREGEVFDIYCLPHLRRDVLRGVLAHEFAHAFLQEHYPSVKSVEENEGFCEWVRYRFMKAAGDARGVEALMKRDDFYGKAFRAFLDVERAGGVAGVFDHIGRHEPSAANPKRGSGNGKKE